MTNSTNEPNEYKGKQSDMIEFTKFLVSELDIKLYNNVIYFKDGNQYSSNEIKLLRAMTKYLPLRRSQDTEVFAQIPKYAEYIEDNKKFKVKVQNGVIVNYSVVDSDYGFTPFYLDVTYDPNAYDENVDKFLKFLCNEKEDMRIVLEELLGHCLMVDKFPHKIFFLTGSGANGKSTFVEMITNLIGDLSSHIDIKDFDDGTCIVSLIGKLANIADDVDAIHLEKSKNLKTLASGNTISARAIYSRPVTIRNTATLIFTANVPPTFRDKSNGIVRRLTIIPFNNRVQSRIPNLDELLSTDNAKSYLLNLALAGVKRIYDNNFELSISETIQNATRDYYKENDSFISFIDTVEVIDSRPFSDFYSEYVEYCSNLNIENISANMFSRRLKTLGYKIDVKNIEGKSHKVIYKS